MGSLVSVITPTYNCAKYVCQAVDSALAQTYTNIEVIVVDDSSTDDTRERLAQYGDRIRYIYQEHRERSAARNTGIRNARGEYLAFLDADDIWLPHKLERQVPILDQAPDVGLVYCWAYFIDPEGRRIVYNGKEIFKSFEAGSRVFEQLLFRNVITAACSTAVIRRECVDKVGMFDESLPYAEDQDLWMRISLHYQIAVIPETLTYYRRYDADRDVGYERQDYYVTVTKKACSYLSDKQGVSRSLMRSALSQAHWLAACACHQAGQNRRTWYHLAQAVARDPDLLHQRAAWSILMDLTLGKRLSARLRTIRRGIQYKRLKEGIAEERLCDD